MFSQGNAEMEECSIFVSSGTVLNRTVANVITEN